jgi:anhydro-N-acetylmuramic acid kinase
MSKELFIGLMSGTSLDGIDAVLVSFDDTKHSVQQLACRQDTYPDQVKEDLFTIIENPQVTSSDLHTTLDRDLALHYSQSVSKLLRDAGIAASDIAAIGCHGQTVNHQPDANPPFSLQLGSGSAIAAATGIKTINDFRRADIELGGQGAPLVPAFHEWAFGQSSKTHAVVNIGGIANITVLSPGQDVIGFDTGPGNTLLDLWTQQNLHKNYDANGDWGRTGQLNAALLKHMLADNYFLRQPPKSTGREYFNLTWLREKLNALDSPIDACDVQATLTDLTARSIATAVQQHQCAGIWVCGGGAHNDFLCARISQHYSGPPVQSTAALGIEPDWVEAIAFAWLAMSRINEREAGRPSVTGARAPALLGDIHLPVNL